MKLLTGLGILRSGIDNTTPEPPPVVNDPGTVPPGPASPGSAARKRDDGYVQQTHSVVYRNAQGALRFYKPGSAQDEIAFKAKAIADGYTLVPRSERRALWLAERRRYKKIVAQRKRAEQCG